MAQIVRTDTCWSKCKRTDISMKLLQLTSDNYLLNESFLIFFKYENMLFNLW